MELPHTKGCGHASVGVLLVHPLGPVRQKLVGVAKKTVVGRAIDREQNARFCSRHLPISCRYNAVRNATLRAQDPTIPLTAPIALKTAISQSVFRMVNLKLHALD